jgi:gliding motility-associated-like protein
LPVTVTSPLAPLSIQPTLTNVGCYGDSSGAITTLISGGTPSYSILWNGQIGSNNLSNISAGNYTIEVTDSNGCLANQSIDITQPNSDLSVSPVIINIDCNGNSSGTIDLNPSGGTAPYNTTWNNGFNGSTLTGASHGSYQYTIVDANQCAITGTADITQPSNALSVNDTINNVSCNGLSNGSIILSIGGGTTPYNYLWSNGSTTADLSNVIAGNYTVTISDANGCVYTKSYLVAEPTLVLSTQQVATQVSCFGDNSGSITITPSGGTAPYSYSWNTGSTNSSISNLLAGNYSVLVTDANGCTSNLLSTITQPTNVLTSSATTTPVNCSGNANGSISLTPSGGTAPYTYLWNNNATTQNLNSLIAGVYTVTITDANSCTYVYSSSIQQPIAVLSTTYLVQDVACFGGATGIINSLPIGGTAPYTYSWSNGLTSANLSNVSAGTYTLTITDANGCTFSQPVTVSQPIAAVAATNTTTNINCHGDLTGTINVTVSGGLGNYSFQWNNGATTEDLNALAPGNYLLVVTDQNGCTASTSASISQPSMSTNINLVSQPVSCFGMQNGAVTSTVVGGTGPYIYIWNTGATSDNISGVSAGIYTITVTDNNGCSASTTTTISEPTAILDANLTVSAANCVTNQMGNINVSILGGTAPYTYLWNNGGTAQNLLNQPPGSYWVKVTDANGCEVTKNADINDLTSVTISADDMEICIGGTATITTTSIPGATYQWIYNGNALNGAVASTFVTPVAGIYTVVATTSCGAYTSNPIEISVRTLNTVTVSNDVIICNGESFQLQAGGGMDYSWSPTNGLNQTDIPNPVASPSQTTTYTVTVRDANGCTATAAVTVNVMCDTLDIPNGFSPNNDGTNDYFVIDGIDAYPGNVLFIYNRWGNLIYKQKDYANKWDGRSNVNGVMFGQELPNGTYYFILDLNIEQKPVNGFVVIRR